MHLGCIVTTGRVIEASGGVYSVSTPSGKVEAFLRGRLKRGGTGDRVVVGDRVGIRESSSGGYVIEKVHPRRTSLARRTFRGRTVKVVVANLDHLLVVASVADPPPSREVIDRMLVMGESGGLEAHLVLTKIDLAKGHKHWEVLTEAYRTAGYPVLGTSVVTGAGMETFRRLTGSGSSALIGPSGTGKSSLLNRLDPKLSLRTQQVGRRSRIGRHTTVSSRLVPLPHGGYVADTPGFSDVGIGDVAPVELGRCFADFRPYLGRCRFRDCVHVYEPGCAVLRAVAEGGIERVRHRNYRTVLEEL